MKEPLLSSSSIFNCLTIIRQIIMSSQTARVSITITDAVVTDNHSVILGEKFMSGTELKTLNLPVYCDVIITQLLETIKISDANPPMDDIHSQANPSIKLLKVMRRHIRLNHLLKGFFPEHMIIQVNDNIIKSEWIKIRIGYNDKTDAENLEYSRNLYNEINKSSKSIPTESVIQAQTVKPTDPSKSIPTESTTPAQIVKPTNPISPKLKAALNVIASSFRTIQNNDDLKTCMESIQYMFETCSIDITDPTMAAYNKIITSFARFQDDPKLRSRMEAIQFLSGPPKTIDEIINSLQLLTVELAHYSNTDPDHAAISAVILDLFQ